MLADVAGIISPQDNQPCRREILLVSVHFSGEEVGGLLMQMALSMVKRM